MKAYFEPKMNISVFDAENVATTSGNGVDSLKNAGNVGSADYSKMKQAASNITIQAGMDFTGTAD